MSKYWSDEQHYELLTFLAKELPSLYPELGIASSSLELVTPQGYQNHTFSAVSQSSGKVVVRVRHSSSSENMGDWSHYLKEAWCLTTVRAAGLPAPQLRGQPQTIRWEAKELELALLITEFIDGRVAEYLDPAERVTVGFHIGQLARSINQITTVGFGKRRAVDTGHFQQPWSDWLRTDEVQHGVDRVLNSLTRSQRERYQERRDTLSSHPPAARLTHADLNDTNIIVGQSDLTVRAVIDWEFARSSSAPAGELLQKLFQVFILHNRCNDAEIITTIRGDGVHELATPFFTGYGVRYAGPLRVEVETMLLLKAIPFLNWWLTEGEKEEPGWSGSVQSAWTLVREILERTE